LLRFRELLLELGNAAVLQLAGLADRRCAAQNQPRLVELFFDLASLAILSFSACQRVSSADCCSRLASSS
jgi:hypothetical protein